MTSILVFLVVVCLVMCVLTFRVVLAMITIPFVKCLVRIGVSTLWFW